jgi:hypothetical protein
MKQIAGRPPNFEAILAAFPGAANPDVIFAYGDRVFVPSGRPLSPQLEAHEQVHLERQAGDPAAWWERYIADADFRFSEELLAHQAEYRAFDPDAMTRPQRRQCLAMLAERLSGPLYGGCVSFGEAKKLIRGPIHSDGSRVDIRPRS